MYNQWVPSTIYVIYLDKAVQKINKKKKFQASKAKPGKKCCEWRYYFASI